MGSQFLGARRVGEPTFHDFGSVGYQEVNLAPLRFGETLQNEVGRILGSWRSSHANLESRELGAQHGDDRTHAVMASTPPPHLKTQSAQSKVDIVMNH